MSRIAGLISRNNRHETSSRESILNRALLAQSHDAGRQHLLQNGSDVALGWCGWQKPQLASVNGICVTLDGYIYNRRELGSADSDARLLADLYAQHGFTQALRLINGDFAAALYDSKTQTLWLGRDRFGLRPLYYVNKPAFFAFASRPRALLVMPEVSREVDPKFVALFAASHYRYFDNDREQTAYAELAQLPAAQALCLSQGKVEKTVYWSLEDVADLNGSEADLASRYRELLIDAVALRLDQARRPAFTLSGGMDSSSVLASAVHHSGSRQVAFSTVYSDETYDESKDIQSILESTVEEWHPIMVGTPDVFDLVQQMIRVHDEPVATATWLSHFIMAQEVAKRGFGSLFGGLGGDELNAGEYEYFFFFFADLKLSGNSDELKTEVEKWIEYHNHPIFRKSFAVMQEGLDRLVDLSKPGKCLPDEKRMRRYYSALNAEFFDLSDFQPTMDHQFRSYLKSRTYQDIFRETAPCCLRAEDRQTVAFGLDNFLPFFDHRLVEFMFRVPGTMKIKHGVTKHLLRKAMRGVLPEETRARVKKTGWNAPAHIWFSGRGRDSLLDLVHSQSFRERGVYNVPEVLRIIEEHDQIVSTARVADNHMMFLWQLVNLELWLEGDARQGS
jgi:asparagine synthase (glutamine-hydrolysing)